MTAAEQLDLFPEPSPWRIHTWHDGSVEVQRDEWSPRTQRWVCRVCAWGDTTEEALRMAARRGVVVVG